ARAELPSYNWIYNEGFTENEITEFTRLMERHAHLFYKYALEEGETVAQDGGICLLGIFPMAFQ
ncbi:MAG: hypothetical protein J6R67_06170, partial [Treponema sp.]|nr:hypothetical protein [Treponema sp.]